MGHYVAMIKSYGFWLYFDDEDIDVIEEETVRLRFGSTNEMLNHTYRTDSSYLLFYEQAKE